MIDLIPKEKGETFRIVLLYDRFTAAARALTTYRHLARELAGELRPQLRIWRMDAALSAYAGPAGDDIAAAELIIITASGNQACPAAFRHWRGGVVTGGSAPPQGIVALVGTKLLAGPAEDSWTSVLLAGAKQIHPDVYVFEPPEIIAATGSAGPNFPSADSQPQSTHENHP